MHWNLFGGLLQQWHFYHGWENRNFVRRCFSGFSLCYFRRCISEFVSEWNLVEFVMWLSVCNACAMTENNHSRLWLGRVSQTASVRHERVTARTTRPWVYDNLFHGSQRRGLQPSDSTSRSLQSQTSTSRDHESPNNAAPEA